MTNQPTASTASSSSVSSSSPAFADASAATLSEASLLGSVLATGPRVSEVVRMLDQRCMTRFAEPWDAVGLAVGDPQQRVTSAVVALDLGADVLTAAGAGAFVLLYHPPIFQPIKRLIPHGQTAWLCEAVRRQLALYSPHTGLDVAPEGTSDCMAETLGLQQVRPLRSRLHAGDLLLLSVMCPMAATDRVREAMCAAGAGVIGHYSHCSFTTRGMGTFFGDETTHPAVGAASQLMRVDEDRVEVLVRSAHIGTVLQAMRSQHPYETPAFELASLQEVHDGVGRLGTLSEPCTLVALAARVRASFGADRALIAAGKADSLRTVTESQGQALVLPAKATASLDEGTALLREVAVSPGAGSSLVDDVCRSAADVFVTGELPHHAVRQLTAAGKAVICVGHGTSERPVLRRLANWLTQAYPHLPVTVVDASAEVLRLAD